MKTVKPSANYVEMTDIPHTQLMEQCDQLCYELDDKIAADSAEKFINFAMGKKHNSIRVKTDILNRKPELIKVFDIRIRQAVTHLKLSALVQFQIE